MKSQRKKTWNWISKRAEFCLDKRSKDLDFRVLPCRRESLAGREIALSSPSAGGTAEKSAISTVTALSRQHYCRWTVRCSSSHSGLAVIFRP